MRCSATLEMSGKRHLLDTNAIIALLKGNTQLVNCLNQADWIGISIISQLEFLAFANLSDTDKDAFDRFLQRIEVVGLETHHTVLLERIVELRQQYRLKLPDAIIAATAVYSEAILVTADKVLNKLSDVSCLNFS